MAGDHSLSVCLHSSVKIHQQVIPLVSSFPSIQKQGILGLEITRLMKNAVTKGSVLF